MIVRGRTSSCSCSADHGRRPGTPRVFRNTLKPCTEPPYGFDWKASQEAVKKEALAQGSRFSHGLPSVGDGQMLFLSHLAHKMRPAHEGGGRVGIVLNGSPLFSGAADSGPSRIRQWLLESDLVEAIIALPMDMFFNTGIASGALDHRLRTGGSP